MGALFGGPPAAPPPPPAPMLPVIEETPEPMPEPDKQTQRTVALKAEAERRARLTTRRNTIIGDDTLG